MLALGPALVKCRLVVCVHPLYSASNRWAVPNRELTTNRATGHHTFACRPRRGQLVKRTILGAAQVGCQLAPLVRPMPLAALTHGCADFTKKLTPPVQAGDSSRNRWTVLGVLSVVNALIVASASLAMVTRKRDAKKTH